MDVRGEAGSVAIGDDSNVEASVVLERDGATVRIGSRTHVGGGTLIDASSSIVIGDDVLVSFGVLIADHDSHSLDFAERRDDVRDWMSNAKEWSTVPTAPVVIGDKAWIGARAILLKGVHVGEGAVVAAGAVVTRDVDAWTLVAGNPARRVKSLPMREAGAP